jgi:hypothetical protein
MSIKDQLTAEQWKVLINAPGAASTYVSTASGGGLEVFNEILTASKFTAKLSNQAGGSGYGELVDELLATIKGMTVKDAQENSVKYQSTEPAAIRAELKQYVAGAVDLIKSLPGADGYKRWILDMVREVAETKTGGFLGIGAKSVIDEKEQAAINEMAALLGL